MQARTLSPAGLFGADVRYVVPLFQRPYVWTRDDQWEPLWEDIRTLTEQLMDTPPDPYGGVPVPPHFLGAIVLDQQRIPAGFIAMRHVIDGQQRLTTSRPGTSRSTSANTARCMIGSGSRPRTNSP